MSTELKVSTRVDIINEKIEALKEDFAKFIKDTEYPLVERWSVFSKANIELSTIVSNDNYVPFKNFDETKEWLLERNIKPANWSWRYNEIK